MWAPVNPTMLPCNYNEGGCGQICATESQTGLKCGPKNAGSNPI